MRVVGRRVRWVFLECLNGIRVHVERVFESADRGIDACV